MQYINLNKTIDLNTYIEDLLLINIDDKLDIIDNKDGIKINGKILIGGSVKTKEENKEFYEDMDLDIFLTYEEILDRNILNVSINDFEYKIENNKLELNISLKIEGLKEIETTFLTEKNNELIFEEEVENDEKEVYISKEVIANDERKVKEEYQEKIEDIKIIKENESETRIRKSLIKSVFSNKRIKEEVFWKLHCVKGEKSYEEIASKYNVDLNELKSINKNEILKDGKLIFLPIE